MLKVNIDSGETLTFDLSIVEEEKKWNQFAKDLKKQKTITGLLVIHKGVTYALPTPRRFRKIIFMAEYVKPNLELKIKGGTKMFCFADNIQITMMVHREQKAVRVFVEQIGNMKFNPILR